MYGQNQYQSIIITTKVRCVVVLKLLLLVLLLKQQQQQQQQKQQQKDDKGRNNNEKDDDGVVLFGADLISAIDTSIEKNIPLFIGDEYTQETKLRFINTLTDISTYIPPTNLILEFFSFNKKKEEKRVDLIQTFLRDPSKLIPLFASVSVPLVVFLGIPAILVQLYLFFSNNQDPLIIMPFLSSLSLLSATTTMTSNTDNSSSSSIFLSILFSIFISSKVYNTLIIDRDVVLASRAENAAKIIHSLKQNQLIRKAWTFPVSTTPTQSTKRRRDDNTATTTTTRTTIPLFTLKRPLKPGLIRNLNLFEPRWLSMIDKIVYNNNKNNNNPPQFGCISCVNKFYSVVTVGEKEEGRYADIIFQPTGRMATLLNVTEAQRPSGARKILTQIQGNDDIFTIQNNNNNSKQKDTISVTEEGYLQMITNNAVETKEEELLQSKIITDNNNINDNNGVITTTKEDMDYDTTTTSTTNNKIKIVIVVGLLHANGVLSRLTAAATNTNDDG